MRPGHIDHLLANFQANAGRRLEFSELMAGTAPDRKDLSSWLDQETQEPAERPVIIAVPINPAVPDSRDPAEVFFGGFSPSFQGSRSPYDVLGFCFEWDLHRKKRSAIPILSSITKFASGRASSPG
jgi:hypothetical protein